MSGAEVQPPSRSCLATIFVSPGEQRLRAGWRLMIQVIIQLGLSAGVGIPALLAFGRMGGTIDLSQPAGWVFNEVVELGTILGSVLIARRLLDKRSFASLGFHIDRAAAVDLGIGMLIAAVMMGVVFAAEYGAGWLRISSLAWQVEPPGRVLGNAGVFLLVFALGGFNEELMSRGYHLQTIASGLNLAWGLILSSAAFGVLHLANPHATWVSVAGICGAGLFLGFAYVWTRQLWLPISLHLGWNYFEGILFGFPVSGLQTYHLVRTTISGPQIWTGGEFGPEAGLIVLPALAVGVLLVYAYCRVRSRL